MDKIPLDDLKQRTVIVGNSGAGKSTLAEKLAHIVNVPAIDLDQLHWEEGGYRRKRNEQLAKCLVRDVATKPHWIIEGVFGWMAEVALPRATALIWLDIPWNVCRESLVQRGLLPGATDRDHADLLAWAEAYWDRQTSSSFTGHARLFADFSGPKLKLSDRGEVHKFISELRNAGQRSN
jgi:adenylate kinase family enzyme